jgi:cysteine desulfurase
MAGLVYLDSNATTAVTPAVLEAMLPWLAERSGNPSSRHSAGRAARDAVDRARQQVAAAVGAHETEIIFTSGGSEANNLFLRGLSDAGGVIAAGATEHPSVREPIRLLGRQGMRAVEIPVDVEGRIDRVAYRKVLDQRPRFLSVMIANNETGVIEDVASLAAEVRAPRTWFHSDAVQALGKIPLSFRDLNDAGVHALSLSAHKLGGPKGVGALVMDKRLPLLPLIVGGGQERGLRSGTENVAAIVGFATACTEATADLADSTRRLASLRDNLEAGLVELGATIFGHHASRLPNTSFFALPDLDGETLVGKLDRAGFAVASGSACSSSQPGPSHVLLAMGVSPQLAQGAVRVSLGRQTTADDVSRFLTALAETSFQLKRLAALAG